MTYFLMHEDEIVALFQYEEGEIDAIQLSPDTELYPVGVQEKQQLREWLKQRTIPVTRDGIEQELKEIQEVSTFHLAMKNLCLSLTDHYWVKEITKEYSWADVNLYQNDFRAALTLDLKDDMADICGKTNFVPSASLKGDLKKKWIIGENGKRILVKGNYEGSTIQSISEVLASKLHRLQGWQNYVEYSFLRITAEGESVLGCACENFTDIDTEFVPAIDVIHVRKKRNDESYYEMYLSECVKHGISEEQIRSFLEYQIMTDFILSNTDRHFNNFGIIRNSKSLKWLKPAPIFDSGNAMFYKSSFIPSPAELLKIKVNSFLEEEVNLLKYITNTGRELVDLLKLPKDQEVYQLLKKDSRFSEEFCLKILSAYRTKIRYLSDFKSGLRIWDYNYKKKQKKF